MDCKHERLRTVGDRVFCCSCGEELSLEFLKSRNASVNDENRANKAVDEPKMSKSPSKKRTAKKAV